MRLKWNEVYLWSLRNEFECEMWMEMEMEMEKEESKKIMIIIISIKKIWKQRDSKTKVIKHIMYGKC